jgi:hypothetical protein
VAIRELAEAWASLYSNSVALRSAVSFAHVGGLLTGGGAAITTDLAILGLLGPDRGTSRETSRVHRVVVGSLVVVIASGLLLLLKDLDALIESRPFWIKMALFGALLVNGGLMLRVEARASAVDAAVGTRLRAAALASLVLWLATTLAGAVVPNAL